MVAVFKANGIDVVQDIVLNHVTGAGSVTGNGGRDPLALDDGSTDKYKNFRYVSYKTPALNSTAGNYTSREGRFPKNWPNFYPNNGLVVVLTILTPCTDISTALLMVKVPIVILTLFSR